MHDTNNEVSDQSNKGLYDKAFQTLCEEINEDLFHEGKLLLLTSLSERYHDILKSIDSSFSSLYTTHRLKDRLQQLYGDRIKIEKDPSQKLIIFSSKITVGHAGGTAQKYKRMLHARESLESQLEGLKIFTDKGKTVIRDAAALLVNDIRGVTNEDTYPSPYTSRK